MYNDVYCSGAKSRLRYKKSTRRRRKNLGKNNQQKPTPAPTPAPAKVEEKETPASKQPVVRQELPNTGTGNEMTIFGAAASAILAGIGMVGTQKTKKEDEEA